MVRNEFQKIIDHITYIFVSPYYYNMWKKLIFLFTYYLVWDTSTAAVVNDRYFKKGNEVIQYKQ